jgi:hypothetical protein
MCMVQRRNLSIGITVNLDNYENLRLEVSGEACGEGDAEELIAYLDSILSRLGRGTTETAERVDSYRRRVLAPSEPSLVKEEKEGVVPSDMAVEKPVAAKTPAPAPAIPAPVLPAGIQETTPVAPVAPAPVPPVGTKELPSSAAIPKPAPHAPSPAPRKESPPSVKKEGPSPQAKKEMTPPPSTVRKEAPAPTPSPKLAPAPESRPAPKEEGFSCERCGEPITPVERKLSRMFQNKDLCKKCLQTL